jgi:hypothetical protein
MAAFSQLLAYEPPVFLRPMPLKKPAESIARRACVMGYRGQQTVMPWATVHDILEAWQAMRLIHIFSTTTQAGVDASERGAQLPLTPRNVSQPTLR